MPDSIPFRMRGREVTRALLFVVLFYTYPLKFMFALVTGQIRIGADGSMLMVIYGLGFAGIFALFVAMYAHAWRKRQELELSEVELYDTKTSMIMYGSYVTIGLSSALLGSSVSGPAVKWAGLMYWLPARCRASSATGAARAARGSRASLPRPLRHRSPRSGLSFAAVAALMGVRASRPSRRRRAGRPPPLSHRPAAHGFAQSAHEHARHVAEFARDARVADQRRRAAQDVGVKGIG